MHLYEFKAHETLFNNIPAVSMTLRRINALFINRKTTLGWN